MSNPTSLIPYLNFNGNCREAMNFYKDCLGGDLDISTYEGSPMEAPAEAKNNVLHSTLIQGNMTLMASDSMAGHPLTIGNNVGLSINCSSREELDNFYDKMVVGGKATMDKQDTFWGAYFGMLTDKYGVNWMFNYDAPKK